VEAVSETVVQQETVTKHKNVVPPPDPTAHVSKVDKEVDQEETQAAEETKGKDKGDDGGEGG
jgi:hypothetical protein